MARLARLVAATTALTLLPASLAAAQPPEQVTTRKAERALSKLERIESGRDRGRSGREVSHLLRDLAVGYRGLDPDERAEARSFLARPDDNPPSSSDPFFADYEQGDPDGRLCDARFCVHYQDVPGADAPDLSDASGNGHPDYVDEMLAAFATSASTENDTLGWPAAASDGSFGGDARTDVYVLDLDIDSSGILGYSAPDPLSTQPPSGVSFHAYLVMDDDYQANGLNNPDEVRNATAAHEYNHVLQYGIDVLQDPWMFEATAVWMEDKVFDADNDYARFLQTWTKLSQTPLTTFTQDLADPASEKAYGNAVWNHWIEQRFGADAVLQNWTRAPSASPAHFSLAAWDDVIRSRGGSGFATEFSCFAAATAEWTSAAPDNCAGRSMLFPDAQEAGYPDMQRVTVNPTIDGPPVTGSLDHTTYALFNLPAGSGGTYKLIGNVPAGTAGAVAFVGRRGSSLAGPVTARLAEMPSGGAGSVLVEAPASFTRLTAVLVNADRTIMGFSTATNDWNWQRDRQTASIRISSDVTPPGIVSRTPAPNAERVPVTSLVVTKFSEVVNGVDSSSVVLTAPGARPVPATVTLDAARTTAILTPTARLAQRTRYTAQLTSAIADGADNHIPPTSWSFTTIDLPPAFAVSASRRQRARDVRRRGAKLLVRSTDSETLTLTMRALAPGRRSGPSKKLRLRPGARRTLRLLLSRAARARLASRRPVRVKLSVAGRDPSGKRKTRTRTVTVRP